MANINVGAVILTGIVIVGSTMIGSIARLLNGASIVEIHQVLPFFKAAKNKQQKRE